VEVGTGATHESEGGCSPQRTRWPITARAFADVTARMNIGLAMNAAEIGFGRFLFAVRDGGSG